MKRFVGYGLLLSVLFLLPVGFQGAAHAQARGTVGAAGGGMLFTADKDMSTDALIRPIGSLLFEYVSPTGVAGVLGAGFGWNAYEGRPDTLATIWPFTFGLEYRFGHGTTVPRLGVGGGLYVITILNKLKVRMDPVSRVRLRTVHPGVYASVGVERFKTEKMSYTLEALWHHIFSEDPQKFKSGYEGNDEFFEVRVGIHYYFEPGILNR